MFISYHHYTFLNSILKMLLLKYGMHIEKFTNLKFNNLKNCHITLVKKYNIASKPRKALHLSPPQR